ncbi:MAG: DNA polymerase III subunit delta [Bacteroidaceae bacterium]|nr:DNA polymerase III subunit delta [Bacteroidaceae bacterium]
MKELRSGIYKPIYILHGEEPYYIDVIADYIAENALNEDEKDFNQVVMYGADTTAAEIADQARRFPMLSERQVVIVKEAQAIKKWEQLEAYLDKPLASSVIVICHKNGKIDGRKKICSKAAKVGVVYESVKKYPNELPAFVAGYMEEHHPTMSIDTKAMMMVVEHIGNDLSRIASELEKVISALPTETKQITPQIVEERIGISKEYNSYEMQDAIAAHDSAKAMRIADYFAKDPKSQDNAFKTMPILFGFFQNLMICHYMDVLKTENNIAQALSFRGPWQARPYATALRYYSPMKTFKIISKIRETDIRSKGVDNRSATPGDLLKELVFFIMN